MTWDLFTSAQEPAPPPPEPPVDQPEEPGYAGELVEPPVYSVSEVNAAARGVLTRALGTLLVRGEVSNWKRYGSGHRYFSLKDDTAQIRCVMFRTDAVRLPIDPDDGMEVRVLCEPTLYEPRGEFQLVVRALEAIGSDGLWRLAFERLRARLDADGLLAPGRKRALPECPATVGIVTSGVGAALRDIINVIERRAPWTRVVFRHARVQGEGAADEVAEAIEFLCAHTDADVLIVGRGGGSIEDLWAFNEERVARAIAACPIPVISAVGHEVDYTIADLVADVRAPTPSAAAEYAVPERADLVRRLVAHQRKLAQSLRRGVERRAVRLDRSARELTVLTRGHLRDRRERMGSAAARLEALSPLASLARGYAVPLAPDGRVLRRAADFQPSDRVRLRVTDAEVDCRVDGVRPLPRDGATMPEEGAA
ncbi:MAG TPA: exodeoxyribonuclease VII large subunit [Longimicrobiales bacterium]|nr:exodeoxyribonuclease VII large subunit [Longimicrobiales bacterium]